MRVLSVALLLASAIAGCSFGTTSSASAAKVGGSSSSSSSKTTAATASGYNPNTAMDALFYSKAVTCSASQIANWTCASCGFNPAMQEVNVYTARDTQAYVGYDAERDNVVIAIRGSANIQNWLDDFTFELVPYPLCATVEGGCKVHKGFLEVYTALQTNMIPYVKAALARHPTATLFVTGHSLGAAISLLAALDLYSVTQNREVSVYNFGEPRVGDTNFTRFAVSFLPQKSQFRITHHEDPVPHLPPIEFGFLHVPHEIFYDNDGNTTWIDCVDSYLQEDKTCSDKYPIPILFGDHTRYLGIHTGCSVTADALAVRPHVDLSNKK